MVDEKFPDAPDFESKFMEYLDSLEPEPETRAHVGNKKKSLQRESLPKSVPPVQKNVYLLYRDHS